MKFKIDENLPADLAEDLRSLGHEADTVFDERLGGIQDLDLVKVVIAESRIFMTLEKGLANPLVHPPHDQLSIVLFRPPKTGRHDVLAFVRARLDAVFDVPLQGNITIVTSDRIRIR
jgi:predicted nuclease of predicted toxin-antitoxin system